MPTLWLIAPTALSVVCAVACLLTLRRTRRRRAPVPVWWDPPTRRRSRHALGHR